MGTGAMKLAGVLVAVATALLAFSPPVWIITFAAVGYIVYAVVTEKKS